MPRLVECLKIHGKEFTSDERAELKAFVGETGSAEKAMLYVNDLAEGIDSEIADIISQAEKQGFKAVKPTEEKPVEVKPEAPKAEGKEEKRTKNYFTVKKAKALIATNFKSRTDEQLQKDIVKLRDYRRYMGEPELYGEYLAEGGYYVKITDPSASGFTPKDAWLQSNTINALDEAEA
ncbi:hypothetical protein LCGC14_2018510, partial [marine sediment metagenome]